MPNRFQIMRSSATTCSTNIFDCSISEAMLARFDGSETALGRGVYSAADAARLLNFHRDGASEARLQVRTLHRWLRGYDFTVSGETRHAQPLWQADYASDEGPLELSFRDLIELRFVKAFRELGLPLPAIRTCFERAVEAVQDERPFSTRRFRTDGRTIFLEITSELQDGEMVDLKRRQHVFRTIVAPSLKGLEFDAEAVARWYPLGLNRRSLVIDPRRAFGKPIAAESGIPAEVLADAVAVEGSVESAARAYEVPVAAVRDAAAFQGKLAA